MKKLYTLIIRTYLPPFILTFFISLFILVMQFLWKYIDELVGKGLEWYTVGELLLYASANLVPLALPLAILLSSIMTFGNFGEKYELVAMKSAGLPLLKIMRPLIFITFLTALLAFYFSNNIWPKANLEMARLLYDIRNKKPAFDIQQKVYYKGIENYVIRVEEKHHDGQTLFGVTIYDHSEKKGNKKVVHAKRGEMVISENQQFLILTLYNGTSYEELYDPQDRNNSYPFYRTSFEKEVIRLEIGDLSMQRSDRELFKDNFQMLSLTSLVQQHDTLTIKLAERKVQYQNQIHDKHIILRSDSGLKTPGVPIPGNKEWLPELLENYDLGTQKAIAQNAVSLSRNVKMYAHSLHNEFSSRESMLVRYIVEWHRKFTLSYACIILFFIGAPLGTIIRKGGIGMPVVMSVIFFLIFHILSITGEKLVKQGGLTPWLGMWLASICLTPMGFFLTYKASVDASMLQAEFYQKLMTKLTRLFRGKRNKE